MRVFLDTNVLVSAFVARGLCADVLRGVLSRHELLVGEVVLEELERVLRERMRLPAPVISGIAELLREREFVPKPAQMLALPIRDPADRWILSSAAAAKADVLVTGDQDLLIVADHSPVPILNPRAFWEMLRREPSP